MNRRTQLKLHQLGIIIISWLVIGFLIAVYDHMVLYTNNSLGPSAEYTFLKGVAVNMGAGLLGALIGGSFLVFFVNVRFQDKSYGYTILAVTCSFVLVIMLVNIMLRLFSMPDNSRLVKNGLVWAIVVATTQLLLQVNSKFGQGIFWDIIRGKYNTPKEERRIFMFLDLNASTTIAEQLGDKKYHELLKDFFTDITNPILDNKGEIYQYVGDEVVIAWKYEDGIENSKCIHCFFDIKAHLQTKRRKYLALYDVLPSFKAGIHCGKVVAGEVGIVKRDITYSGDVLNTTSRIQNLCKEFNQEVIVSADLIAELDPAHNFMTLMLGSIKLRGREKEVRLIALKPTE
jgi:adenylate cyclase